MFPIIGIVVVLGCIAGGYLMEKGNMLVLMQPAELLIILGAAIGTVLIGNPPHLLKAIIASMIGVFKGSRYTSAMVAKFSRITGVHAPITGARSATAISGVRTRPV